MSCPRIFHGSNPSGPLIHIQKNFIFCGDICGVTDTPRAKIPEAGLVGVTKFVIIFFFNLNLFGLEDSVAKTFSCRGLKFLRDFNIFLYKKSYCYRLGGINDTRESERFFLS